jgi:hypothetical protein
MTEELLKAKKIVLELWAIYKNSPAQENNVIDNRGVIAETISLSQFLGN